MEVSKDTLLGFVITDMYFPWKKFTFIKENFTGRNAWSFLGWELKYMKIDYEKKF